MLPRTYVRHATDEHIVNRLCAIAREHVRREHLRGIESRERRMLRVQHDKIGLLPDSEAGDVARASLRAARPRRKTAMSSHRKM